MVFISLYILISYIIQFSIFPQLTRIKCSNPRFICDVIPWEDKHSVTRQFCCDAKVRTVLRKKTNFILIAHIMRLILA